ncbi:MAG: ABC transporter ATP-binding protein/permease [Clostridium sp.]|uniref:ABC transporter ATP-binding protein n=1 Tax=Clostridium sp. TaxID=1506 RepID=UPI002A8D204E|nr:ABC transporter ATP-binding protein/permease [Clostridium sp.]MDY5097177.1 ABC transporter ATP-binding protein [Clostridium sp.]
MEKRNKYEAYPEGRTPNSRKRFEKHEKPKDFKTTMMKIYEYFRVEKKLLFLIFAFTIIDSLIVVTIPYIIGTSVDVIAKSVDSIEFSKLIVMTSMLAGAYIADGTISLINSWLMAGISQRIVKTMRTDLFKKLQSLPISFFDTHSNGDIMSRLSNDIDNISSVIAQSTVQLFSGLISIIGTLIAMILLNITLTIVSLITVPLVFMLTKVIAKKTKVLFKDQQTYLGKLNGQIEESISGIEVVKAFNHEESLIEEFYNINEKLRKVGIKAQIWSGFLMPIMNVINNVGFVAIAWTGGILAVKGIINVGMITSFISYSKQFTRPLNDLGNIFNNLQSGVAGAERVFDILAESEEVEDVENASALSDVQGEVIFDNVSFGYTKEKLILKNVSFRVEAGESIALVGPTGAGKTTIVNMVTRFYDVNAGTIYIDGSDIRNYKRDSLRKVFGIVLQDTYLFSGTIKENIRYGNPMAKDEEIIKASKMANAHSFIKRLPKGYDTVLEESGGNLSQGQKQLLTIARAILAKPSILILDEATSSVDTRTELKIQEAMLNVMEGHTTFIIAHRLSTIRDADRIMFIDDGMIVEEGNHEDLMKKKGRYFEMYNSQMKKENTL